MEGAKKSNGFWESILVTDALHRDAYFGDSTAWIVCDSSIVCVPRDGRVRNFFVSEFPRAFGVLGADCLVMESQLGVWMFSTDGRYRFARAERESFPHIVLISKYYHNLPDVREGRVFGMRGYWYEYPEHDAEVQVAASKLCAIRCDNSNGVVEIAQKDRIVGVLGIGSGLDCIVSAGNGVAIQTSGVSVVYDNKMFWFPDVVGGIEHNGNRVVLLNKNGGVCLNITKNTWCSFPPPPCDVTSCDRLYAGGGKMVFFCMGYHTSVWIAPLPFPEGGNWKVDSPLRYTEIPLPFSIQQERRK